jgi:hypothetical protein
MNGSRDYLLEVIERAGEALAAMVTGRTDLTAREEEVDVEVAFDREFGHLHCTSSASTPPRPRCCCDRRGGSGCTR